jgi:hypothetical protein
MCTPTTRFVKGVRAGRLSNGNVEADCTAVAAGNCTVAARHMLRVRGCAAQEHCTVRGDARCNRIILLRPALWGLLSKFTL